LTSAASDHFEHLFTAPILTGARPGKFLALKWVDLTVKGPLKPGNIIVGCSFATNKHGLVACEKAIVGMKWQVGLSLGWDDGYFLKRESRKRPLSLKYGERSTRDAAPSGWCWGHLHGMCVFDYDASKPIRKRLAGGLSSCLSGTGITWRSV